MGVVFIILLSGSITIFNFQGLIFPQMKNAMRGELNNYNQTGHDTSTYGWNSFQKTLGCCGVESYKNWNGTYFDNTTVGVTLVPASCCKDGADCNPDGIKLSGSEQEI